MRHETEHAPRLVRDAGYVALRAVGVSGWRDFAFCSAIAQHNPGVAFQSVERLRICEIISFRVLDRNANDLALSVAVREERLLALYLEIDVAADEVQRGVAHQYAWQQSRLAEDLEAVADA